MLPFQLDKGIFFEDTGKLLRWSEPLQNLRRVDSPEINSTGNVLRWLNKTCFGGKKVTVTIVKDNYKNSDGQLEFVDFEDGQNNPWSLFNDYSKYFLSIFGTPNEQITDGFGRPTFLWNVDHLQIILGVGERFVEFEIFGIHKGKRFWKLT